MPIRILGGLLFLTLPWACSKRIKVDLPANSPQIVVSCYLEDGKPMRALITESTALLDTNLIPQTLLATVVITHNGVSDTLLPGLYLDSAARHLYNYGKDKIVQANYSPVDDWRIDVYDELGRHAWGVTRFLPPVPITSVEPVFNSDRTKAYCLVRFQDDDADKDDYYRLLINRNEPTDTVAIDFLIDSDFENNNGAYVLGGPYRFFPGDTVYTRLYHITKEYYQFLDTEDDARDALLDPFAASGEIVTNIRGGLGVFTALSYTRDTVLVPYR